MFNIQPGEGRLVSLLALYYFFLGAASVFTQSMVFAMFLSEFGPQGLPYMYMATPVVASLVAFLYLKLGERLPITRLLVVNLASMTVVTFLLRLGLLQSGVRALLFFLPIWFQVLANLTILAVWPLAGRLLNMQQGKRLFGLIGSGNWAAIAAGGFVVGPIVAKFGTQNLLLLAGASLVISMMFQAVLFRGYGDRLKVATSHQPSVQSHKAQSTSPFRSKYVILILALVMVWWVGFFFIDNIFYDRTVAQFPVASQLASTLGTVYAVDGVLGLVLTTFLSGPLISRLGVRTSLLVLPALLIAFFGFLAVLGSLGVLPSVLFWIAASGKISNIALGFTLDQTARNILYQPLPVEQRVRIQTMAEGVLQPVAIGLAGVLLLGFNTLLGFGATQLSFMFILVGLVWVGVVTALRKEYPVVLAKALARRLLTGAPLSFADQTSLDVLRQNLASPYPNVVLYTLDLLEQADPAAYAAALPGLLAHSAVDVRQEALRRIEAGRIRSAIPAVRQSFQKDSLPEVRGDALRVLASLGGVDCLDEVTIYVEDNDLPLRRAALVGLLRGGEPEGVRITRQVLQRLAQSPDRMDRMVAAQVIGEVGVQDLAPLLEVLLADNDPHVRRAGLQAAGQLKNDSLWPVVIEGLCAHETGRAAFGALVQGGDSALPYIQAAFDRFTSDPAVQARLAQAYCRIGGPAAVQLLREQLDFPKPEVRSQILIALSRNRYKAQGSEAAAVQKQMETEVSLAAWLLACQVDLGQGEETAFLREAITDQQASCRDRILLLLSFLYDPEVVLRARTHLQREDPSKQAYALEILDVLLPRNVKEMVFPLVEGLDPNQRLQRLSSLFPQPRLGLQARLQNIQAVAGRGNSWMKICAEDAQARLAHSAHGEFGMLTTIEKVMILKSVSIFAEIPGETLAEVARVCEEVEVDEGNKIIGKGDQGDSLYMIVSGQVRVHDGENTLNTLTDRDFFGEMALLDSAPRAASVTAVEHTHLLRLDQEAFFELLEDQPQIARGIIHLLSSRLRERIQDLDEIRNHAGR